MTAPFPTRKQEEWRYADLDALRPVWQQFAEPLTLTVGPGETFEKIWLPGDDDVLVRRVQIALEKGASARVFVLNAATEYGRTELEVSLADGADFELFGANIGTDVSTNEIVTNIRHVGVGGRSRQVIRSVLNGKAIGSYLGKVEVERGAQQTDAEQSVKAVLLDRGLDPVSARALLLEGFVMGLWDTAKEPAAISEAAREALRRVV
jgi:Fe-S cluster assembly protein SufD